MKNNFLASIIEACQWLDQNGPIAKEDQAELSTIDQTLWSMIEDRQEEEE